MNPIVFYLGGAIVLLFAGWQKKLSRDTRNTPMQQYTVEQKVGDIEFRQYPAFTIAQVNDSGTYQEISYRSFQRLASYIFGGNADNKQIAMTTPVGMRYENENGKEASMYFVMPPEANLPAPKDGSVKLIQCNGFKAAAIIFGGVAGESDFKKQELKLRRYLEEKNIHFAEKPEWLRYNPPFQLFDRRNEVVFRLASN